MIMCSIMASGRQLIPAVLTVLVHNPGRLTHELSNQQHLFTGNGTEEAKLGALSVTHIIRKGNL